jgi:colanic acid/amylovoran biosynthesis glycosyltransferase
MKTTMRSLFAAFSLGRSPDSRLNLSAIIGATVARQILSGSLYFAAMCITARTLGPAGNGILATAMLLPQALFAFLNLGMGASHVYHLSSGAANPRQMRIVNWSLAVLLWMVVALVLAAGSEQQIAYYLPGIHKGLAMYASLLFPLLLLAGWSSSMIRGQRDYNAYNRTLLVHPFIFFATVAVLGLTGRVNVMAVVTCHLIGQTTLWLMSESRLRKIGPEATGQYRLRDAMSFGLRAHVSNVITFLNYRLALYLVSFMLGATATGTYVLAVQLAEMLWLFSGAASSIVYPESAANSKSPEALEAMVTKVATLVVQVTLAGALVAAAISVFAIPLAFGEGFRGSVAPFIILLPGIVTWSYMSIISNALAGMGFQKVNIHGALLCLAISAVCGVVAIPVLGTSGAALASTVAFSITALYTVAMFRKIMAAKRAEARGARADAETVVDGDERMKRKRILVVTTSYPYGRNEAFIKAELDYLAQCFAHVELVPSFYPPDAAPRPTALPVNLGYANMRWGVQRSFTVLSSFIGGLWRYAWLDDARRVIRGAHRWENVKELARALYRACLFERFLVEQIKLANKEIDIVYFYWMFPEIAGAIRFRDVHQPSLKVVSRAHRGDLYEDKRSGGYAGLRHGVVAGIDAVFSISDHGRDYVVREHPAAARKCFTARLGVDDPGFENAQPQDAALSVVSCSFVVEEKRLHLLVDAIAQLLEMMPSLSVRWTHIGDGGLFDELRAYAESKLGGGRAELVFTGYLAQEDIMKLYREQKFDVFVNVSSSEGIPVSLMEASSVGIPMVATDVGGSGEIVNESNGVLIPADPDAATVARALARFRDRASAGAYRTRARSDWLDKFSAAHNYPRFGQSLADIASGS